MEICENLRRGRDESGLVAVAASQVLRGDDADRVAALGFYQQNLAVIVSKISALNNLGDERPKFERPDFITFVRHHIAQNENQRVT